jgi:hypothetical protein
MKHSVYLIATLLMLRALAPSALFADDDDIYPPLWTCEEGEKLAPKGRIVTIGHSSFKYCNSTGAIGEPPERGTLHLARESRIAPELERDYPNFKYRGLLTNREYDVYHQGVREPFGKQVIRGTEYTVYVAKHELDKLTQTPGEPHSSIQKIHHAYTQGDIPEHYIFCAFVDPFVSPLPDKYSCSVTITYQPNPSLKIEYNITLVPGWDLPKLDISTLAHQVRSKHRAFELLDVTDVLAGPDVITGIAQ